MIRVITNQTTEHHSDTSRTVTTYDAEGKPTGTRPYTEQENAAADAQIAQSALLTDLTERIARIEAALWPAPPDPEDPEDPSIPEWADWNGVWPASALLRDGGKVWRNITSVPLTTRPTEFPGGTSKWAHLFVEVITGTVDPDPDPYTAWVQPTGSHDAYILGAKVTHNGRLWECTQVNAGVNSYEPGVWGWTDIGAAP